MSLQEKVLRLKLEGVLAVRHARWWEKQIQIHGEEKATAFYTHIGLNHLKQKYEWEGLTLSREPTAAEKLCVKGIAQAQESSKEKLITLLTQLRADLILDGLEGIRKLKPSTYHELMLSASPESRERLRDRLITTYQQGRLLVAAELSRKDAVADDGEFDDLDELTDLTDARVANDVQSRVTAAVARFALLGLVGAQLWSAVSRELADGSVSYIDRAATGLANRVISIGRGDEMRSRSDDIERYEYSAILDQNTCGSCAADDGKEASSPDELPDTPNPDCEGSDFCRCFIVAIAEGNM